MKKNLTTLGKAMSILLLFSIFFSCKTSENVVNNSFIQKRKYTKGYHLSLRKNKNTVKNLENSYLDHKLADNKVEALAPVKGLSAKTIPSKQVNPLQPELVASKQIFIPQIKETTENNVNVEALINTATAKIGKKRTERLIKKATKKLEKQGAVPVGGGKSQLIALILIIFLGGLSAHRFYLGYIWQGIVQIITFGGCGIWWLIDLIRIITGDLGPKDGSYDKTL